MISKLILLGLMLFISINTVFASTAKLACPSFPFFRPSTGPLAVINCDFHQEYEKRVTEIIKTFGTPGGRPIILNLGGTLLLKFNGKSKKIDITPDTYQNLKSFCHMTLAIFLSLTQKKQRQLDTANLSALKNHIQEASKTIPLLKLSPKAKATLIQLTGLSNRFLKRVLHQGYWTTREYDLYFNKAKPLIEDALSFAANIELDALDSALKPWLAQMSFKDRKKIGIVVATAHQARAGELSLQYFAKKFSQRFCEGASCELGLVVLEDKFDEDSAMKLLARHYLDREMGLVLFNKTPRLQRDVLSDATARFLKGS